MFMGHSMPRTPLHFPRPEDQAALGDTERPPVLSAFKPEPASGTMAYGVQSVQSSSSPRVPAAPVVLTRHCATCNERYPADFMVCPRDATPLVDESGASGDPLVGMLLGETYQIVRLVGEGGMGRIYEARHLRLKERRFAVKILHADLAKNPEMATRFMREAEMASSFTHPNVVDVFDVHHTPDGIPYFVGEFLEGEELAGYIEKHGPLDAKTAASMLRQVGSGVSAAHARGIIHRDIKPENIFVLAAQQSDGGSELRVKLLDFGIGKAGKVESTGLDQRALTRTGIIMGTPSYMSPEQARGKVVDHRADIYSAGAVLYFTLTGRKPFDSDDPTSTLSLVLTQDPVRPREIDPKIPEAIELVVQKAMAKDPAERYQTMHELERALAAFSPLAPLESTALVPMHTGAMEPASSTNAHRAFDLAGAVFGAGSNQKARLARPTIVFASFVLGGFGIGTLVAALGGLVRILHEAELTTTECLMLVLGALVAASTPITLYALNVKKHVWPNSVRAMELADDLRKAALASLVAYGALAALARLTHTVVLRSSRGMTSGGWDLVLFFVSFLAGAVVGLAGPVVRAVKKRSRA